LTFGDTLIYIRDIRKYVTMKVVVEKTYNITLTENEARHIALTSLQYVNAQKKKDNYRICDDTLSIFANKLKDAIGDELSPSLNHWLRKELL